MIGDVRRGLISGACGILALAIPPSRHVCMCAQGCVLGGNRFVGSSLVIVDVVIVVCVRACGGRCRCVIQCLRIAHEWLLTRLRTVRIELDHSPTHSIHRYNAPSELIEATEKWTSSPRTRLTTMR
jgi:hypothetical protein